MNAYQDELVLGKGFPFQIDEVTLLAENNADEPFHWHNFSEITCVQDGTGVYYVNGQALEVGPGDILIFNSAQLHGWQVFQQSMRLLVMVFSPSLLAGYGSFEELTPLEPFIGRSRYPKNRIAGNDPCARKIADIMEETYAEWQGRADGYRTMIRADVIRVLTLLTRGIGNARRQSGEKDRMKALKRLQPALEYIDANYCGKLTLKDAAERAYMSPNYFSNYFHTVTDITFSDYVTLRRIRKARELLETSSRSIYEIAIECGFPNSSNFYRLYRKHTGESPRRSRPSDPGDEDSSP